MVDDLAGVLDAVRLELLRELRVFDARRRELFGRFAVGAVISCFSVPRIVCSPIDTSATWPLFSSDLNSEYGIDFPAGAR